MKFFIDLKKNVIKKVQYFVIVAINQILKKK